jgi:cell division protein FtsQ
MTSRNFIRRIIVMAAWVLVGCGLTTLLVAANRKSGGHACREVRVHISGEGEKFFIDKNDIMLLLKDAASGPLVDRPLETIELSRLERSLEQGVWIRDAELYMDSRDVLHVQVTEREPIARVFTRSGASFYIDSAGKQMPLLEKESARVLVVTNFTDAKKYNAADSALAAGVKVIALAVASTPFWKEQIAQLDIMPNGTFEAMPLVGAHVIRLGTAENIDAKLARLRLFYRQVLAKTGFDKYDVVDVQYEGQVVGVQKGAAASTIDSVQLARNIGELLARSRQQMINDSLAQVQLTIPADTTKKPVTAPADTTHRSNPTPPKDTNPRPVKNQPVPVAPKPKPKAVMPRHR